MFSVGNQLQTAGNSLCNIRELQLGIGACRVGCSCLIMVSHWMAPFAKDESVVYPTEQIDSKKKLNGCLLSILSVVDLLKNDFWFGSQNDSCGGHCDLSAQLMALTD